jgi:hypothetical protein
MFPSDRTARHALETADKVLAGAIFPTSAQQEIGALWTHCDDLAWKHPDRQNAIMVGYGAIQAVREALSEKHFGCEHLADTSTDMDVDPYDHDSAFCAAIAYSAGPAWEPTSNAQKRFQFWTWWLRSAGKIAVSVGGIDRV